MHQVVLRGVRALAANVLPNLRVVALTYTGLAGVGALVLVLAVSVTPKPLAKQAVEPARQAVSSFIPPSIEMFGGPGVPFRSTSPVAAPRRVPFMGAVTVAVTIADAETDAEQPAFQVKASVGAATPLRFVPPIATVAPAAEEIVVDEDQPEEATDDAAPVEAHTADAVVVEPAAPVLQMATVEAPRPLPTLPASPQEAKARVDAANQAAIDAAKANQARAKAEADEANQAAIDARKQEQANAPQMADASVSLPTPPASATTAQASKAAADAANQATIDASKAARARAKAEADAANQAAIDAAKAAKAVKP
jgi:hypothetical protein